MTERETKETEESRSFERNLSFEENERKKDRRSVRGGGGNIATPKESGIGRNDDNDGV